MIYLDSCLLIYAFEDRGIHGLRTRELMMERANDSFAISPLATMECLVKPMRQANFELVSRYRIGLARFRQLELSDDVFLRAAEIRARNNLKTADAIHLAAAQIYNCAALWTNDQRLQTASNGYATGVLSVG